MKIHFIGIGGIGVSALAQYYLAKNHKVTGSDLVSSEIIELLIKKGIKISLGCHKSDNVPKDVDLIIYSPAVQKDNPERVEDKKIISYPEALGKLTKKYFTIAISGTHGKSTTCSMLSLVLVKAGFDPTVIVGTKLKEFGNSNFRMGDSKYLIIEADEWNASFLNYYPKIIILTNIEEEHLDYYRDLKHILETYKEYISHLPEDGILVINNDDKNIAKIINNSLNIKRFSLENREKLKEVLKIPGIHNIYNASAVLAVAKILNISEDIVYDSISEYNGAWRRFEIKKEVINNKKIILVSDYGHHPTEVKATLEAAREKFPNKRIWCIFQPHQYQRTYFLFNDFVRVFSNAFIDKIIITDIYDVVGREKSDIKDKVNSKKLVDEIDKNSVIYIPKEKVKRYIEDNIKEEDIILIMGAGDVYKILDID